MNKYIRTVHSTLNTHAHKRSTSKHTQINNTLTIIVIVFGLYLIVTPFWPQISYATGKATGRYSDEVRFDKNPDSSDSDTENIPKDNRLVIPQIGLDNQVYESDSASALQKGIWHRPRSSTPDRGGNTVLVAHRFTYNSPATFYHLDKMKAGDKFALSWNQKRYDYRVREIKLVEPTAIEIEKNTDKPILTLYTCTPLWTAAQRLVIIADLIEDHQ